MQVMRCESRGDPRAYSAGNLGLFQVNAIHRGRVGGNVEALYDPEANVRTAHAIYVDSGRSWRAWGCRP